MIQILLYQRELIYLVHIFLAENIQQDKAMETPAEKPADGKK